MELVKCRVQTVVPGEQAEMNGVTAGMQVVALDSVFGFDGGAGAGGDVGAGAGEEAAPAAADSGAGGEGGGGNSSVPRPGEGIGAVGAWAEYHAWQAHNYKKTNANVGPAKKQVARSGSVLTKKQVGGGAAVVRVAGV